jgi:hypothetical protein
MSVVFIEKPFKPTTPEDSTQPHTPESPTRPPNIPLTL